MRKGGEIWKTFSALMREKGMVMLRASGCSMFPYIRPGDVCRFEPASHPLRAGTVGLVVSDRGVLYAHRLHRVSGKAAPFVYRFRGDRNVHFDNPVSQERVIGVLTVLHRDGRTLQESRPVRRAWSALAVLLSLPLRACAAVRPWPKAPRRESV